MLNTWSFVGGSGTQVTGLTGPLPGSIGFLTHARVISIVEQDFHGPIPRTVGNLKRVEALALATSGLSGPIPEELSTLPRLKELILAGNTLSGEIPASIAMKPLTLLNLSHNELSGVIPGLSFQTLRHLMLNDNQLTGEPLSQITDAPNLRYLHVARNQFTGSFPNALLDASPWQIDIDLAGNQFSGTLPSGVCDRSKFLWESPYPQRDSRLDGNRFCAPFPECFEAWQIGEQDCAASN